MKIETTPLEGVASQDSEMSRAEREHRLWLRGYPHVPKAHMRIWTRSEAVQHLQTTNDVSRISSVRHMQTTMHIKQLEDRMRKVGFKQFFLIEDPEPGDLL